MPSPWSGTGVDLDGLYTKPPTVFPDRHGNDGCPSADVSVEVGLDSDARDSLAVAPTLLRFLPVDATARTSDNDELDAAPAAV